MRYVFWADASPLIGSGHVMRSSAIAEEMIRRGLEVVSIGAITGLPWVSNRIKNLGYSKVVLHPTEFDSNPKNDILIKSPGTVFKSSNRNCNLIGSQSVVV